MKILFPLLMIAASCISPSAENAVSTISTGTKISTRVDGVGLVASTQPLDSSEFIAMKNEGANYVCLLPFAFVKSGEAKVRYGSHYQWWGETREGITTCIQLSHKRGMQVMIKPQLWTHSKFTGDISFKQDSDWKSFEQSYTNYIFNFLRIADSMHVEMFCLGNELDSFVIMQPKYWSWLIDTARKVYNGKLTYAENWDCYDRFPLWDKLDFVGTNAYFPLSNSQTPSVEELIEKWKPCAAALKAISEKHSKQILFTEFGYRSIDYAAKEPWNSYGDSKSNYEAQKNSYEAFFKTFWKEPWCAGGFLWKWFDKNTPTDVPISTDYTPQGKPAMEVVRNWYSQ